jgi:D-amino peptidase
LSEDVLEVAATRKIEQAAGRRVPLANRASPGYDRRAPAARAFTRERTPQMEFPMRRICCAALTALLLATAPPAAARQTVKVFISADMEGIAGVVSPEQLGPSGFEYGRFREFMTAEVLAAIEGAREAGATDIVVADSHGNMQNLLVERLPADVRLVRGSPRPLAMMEGIDSTFAAAIFIGYHSGANNLEGVRAHTMSSARFASVRLNGSPIAESGMNAAIAGHFGVPVVMVSGDDAAVAEVRAMIPGVEGAVVKRAIGFHSAETMTPESARALIRDRARAGVAGRAAIRPHRVTTPVRLDLTFKNYRPAEILAWLPIVDRVADRTIAYTAGSILDVSRFLVFVGAYSADIDP